MKNTFFARLLLIVLTFVASNAFAVIIEGNFLGKVKRFHNASDDPSIPVYWHDVAIGSEVSGSFWYDTEKAPTDPGLDGDAWYNSYTDEWMGSSFSIDGKTYVTSDLPLIDDTGSFYENINISNLRPETHGLFREMFYLSDLVATGNYETNFRAIGLIVSVLSEKNPLINSLGLVQEFDWYYTGDRTYTAQANVSVEAIVDGKSVIASAEVDLYDFHIGVKVPGSVPEPSSILLSFFGLLALAIKYRNLK